YRGDQDQHNADPPAPCLAAAQRRRRPPDKEPSSPRRIWRPISEPIARAALFAAASSTLSRERPPERPLQPLKIPPSCSRSEGPSRSGSAFASTAARALSCS